MLSRLEPIPREELNIEKFNGEKGRIFEAIMESRSFRDAQSFREQCHVAHDYKEQYFQRSGKQWVPTITTTDLGIFFGVSPSSIVNQVSKPLEEHEGGRPPVLSSAIREWVTEIVQSRFLEHRPISYRELEVEIADRWAEYLKPDTLRHIIRAQMANLHTVKGIPTDAGRVYASDESIREWYANLAQKIHDVPREFILNVDETGFSEWADAKDTQVIVPIEYDHPTIKVPVHRSAQRRSMCICIGADGSAMRPFIIVERVTGDEDMRLMGYTEEKVHLSFQKAAFMTKHLWEEWADTVFFPDLARRRRDFQYEGRACLLLDGLTCHYTPAFMDRCAKENVEVIPLVAHSSDQTQPLDLLIFAVAKQHYRSSPDSDLCSDQSRQVDRMMCAIHAATTVHNCVQAFIRAGLIPERRMDGHYYLRVDITQAQGLRPRADPVVGIPAPTAPSTKELLKGAATTFRITKERRTSESRGQAQARTALEGALQDTRARKVEDIEKDSSHGGINAPREDENSSQGTESTTSDESDIPEKSLSQPVISADRSVHGAGSRDATTSASQKTMSKGATPESLDLLHSSWAYMRRNIALGKLKHGEWTHTQAQAFVQKKTPPSAKLVSEYEMRQRMEHVLAVHQMPPPTPRAASPSPMNVGSGGSATSKRSGPGTEREEDMASRRIGDPSNSSVRNQSESQTGTSQSRTQGSTKK
jgi:hypothetical protein